ncbi:MAG: phosphoribosylaminoimidazolesuccinocarboxamide synthase [cyanobacterium endosymbiont of Rhopalodia musculus]|uniref:phosphoribosylaminoimidazolesuccinocarboxamide synthase n=1 Tax=cyanobacterium endosymbiont of Epithemia clementina EcSB TaxID=3034674 RepID=UPI002480EC9F|nr:phosphoribosylaminoimidazolesuccinocarboxamide synthase [cyanobacterium endosymbiont of Epithemia clementina EcSB]WGT66879.1 phosphoribosylaminoimidazolesuccinocarboxamide synthase [cyanobacterium endosymbiont of Epithemia clementina EcSB]
MKKLYEGKAKIIYTTSDPEILLTQFKDDVTAFNSSKRGIIPGKGEINCQISSALFKWLESKNIATHFIDQPAHREMRVRAVKIVPIEVVVRNIAAGSLCRQTGLIEGKILSFPLVEFYLKNDELGDPLLTRDRLLLLELASQKQLEQLQSIALKINQYLTEFFASCQITLVDFKLEFGLDSQGNLLLADEISPDTCRLWDQQTKNLRDRVLDKDRFRHDLGKVEAAYQQVQQRVLEKLGIR